MNLGPNVWVDGGREGGCGKVGKERKVKDVAGQKSTPDDLLRRPVEQATDHKICNRTGKGRETKISRLPLRLRDGDAHLGLFM